MFAFMPTILIERLETDLSTEIEITITKIISNDLALSKVDAKMARI